MQRDMVLEKELRILSLDLQAEGYWRYTGCSLNIGDLKPVPTVMYFL